LHTVRLSIEGTNREIEGKIEGILKINREQIEGIFEENREQPFFINKITIFQLSKSPNLPYSKGVGSPVLHKKQLSFSKAHNKCKFYVVSDMKIKIEGFSD